MRRNTPRGSPDLVIPARLSPDQLREMTDIALRAFKAIDAEGMARVDFFVERDRARPVLNEINTVPGFAPTSMFPKLWEASGLTYAELFERLVELALERFDDASRGPHSREVAPLEGLEPPTQHLGRARSIQLSYRGRDVQVYR